MATDNSALEVRISPVIEREYKRRDVFHQLRLRNAKRVQNGATGVHIVTVALAMEIVVDAEGMKAHRRELQRGIPAAYSALVRNVGVDLKAHRRRSLWADPGHEEADRRTRLSMARFNIGDKVLYFADESNFGEPVTIVGGYRLIAVSSNEGPYINEKDTCVAYRRGYTVRRDGGAHPVCFCPAYKLTSAACKPGYLRLAYSRS